MSNSEQTPKPGTGAAVPPARPAVPERGSGPAPAQRRGPAAFTAGRSTEKSLDFQGSGRRLLRTLRPERPLITAAAALACAGVTLQVIGPRLLGRATDEILGGLIGARFQPGVSKAQAVATVRGQGDGALASMLAGIGFTPGRGVDFGQVGRLLAIVGVTYAVAAVLLWIQARITTTVVQRSINRMRAEAQAKLPKLPLSYFDGQPRGEILSRVTNDLDNIAQTMQQTLGQLTIALLTIVGVLSMMLWISWILALIALVTVPISITAATRLGRRAQPSFVQQWKVTGRLNGHVEEMYTGHALVRVFGRREEAKAGFEELNGELYRAAGRAQFVSGTIQPAMMFINNLNYVLVAVVGALQVASGRLSIGGVQAFIQYSRQFGQPVTQLASMANLLQSAVASAERVFALLDAEQERPDPAEPQVPAQPRGAVEFQDVSFRYTPDKPLIEHVRLSVEPGQTVAIVGPTGAGKTTLVNLLMRFYEPDSGRILLDGTDIAAMERRELRTRTGMVLQDAWLFGGTIAENIAYGRPDAGREQIVAAAEAMHVDHFVRTLPDGYDTVLDDEAATVSAGERQLLTIARAFLTEPSILILDEATSSVDTRTEALIQHAMNRLRAGRTSFVIAHRLSTIRDADLILVMADGRIVEQGRHEDLVRAAGVYARLYDAQFAQAVA